MIYETLKKTGLPVAYSHFKKKIEPPFLVYLGDGQETLIADNKNYWRENAYQVEFYFKKKDEGLEEKIENILEENDYIFDKSEDVYVNSENLYVIYYKVMKGN